MALEHLNQVSAFETLRIYQGRIFFWEHHFKRFTQSARGLGYAFPLSSAELRKWIQAVSKESGWKNAIFRVSAHWTAPDAGVFVAMVRPFENYPEEWYKKGVELRTSVMRRWTLRAQDSQLKASQYVGGVLALLDKGDLPAHELLFLGSSGTVAEGSVSNIFIIKGKRVLTPSMSSGILSGVTRGIVLELCKKAGLETSETLLTRHEFYIADECFMTNTSSEVLPVVLLDGRKIGSGKPGPLTQKLRKNFKNLMKGVK